MKEVFRADGPADRPIIYGTPLIRSHHEYLDRFPRKLVLHILEEVVVPGHDDIVLVQLRSIPKIDVADLASRAGMSTDNHEQPLPASRCLCCSMFFEADVIAKRASQKNVIPGCDIERWNVDLREMFL